MKTTLHIDTAAEMEGVLGANGSSTADRFANIMSTLLQSIMALALLILFFYLIWGAFDWLTSAGEKGKLESARNKMLHAVIGIMILAGSIALFLVVQSILGLEILNFNFTGGTQATPTNPTIQYACLSTGSTICPSGNSGANYSLCSSGCGPPQVCCVVN